MTPDPKTIVPRRISVRGIVLHDGKLLCCKLKPYKGSLTSEGPKPYWCLPGGGLDPEEALLDGMRREMVEETGIEPSVGNLLYIQQFTFRGVEYLEFFFHITNAKDYLHIDLSQTSHGEAEIEAIDFIDPTKEYVLPLFLSSEPLTEQAVKGTVKLFAHPDGEADKLL
jgi:ADP-ribose pyrophosphatase YjhB (NUDIX family)